MSPAAPDPDPDPDPLEADPAVTRAHFRLRVLEELTEIGLALARDLKSRVLAEGEPAPAEAPGTRAAKAFDPAAAFASLSRAIRLTVTLHGKVDEALRALEAGVSQQRAAAGTRAREEAAEARPERRLRIQCLVKHAAENDMWDGADWERLDRALDERLLLDEEFWSNPERTLREIVERCCRYFDLSPDWRRWDEEAWAPPIERPPEPWPWAVAREAAGPETAPTLAGAHALE